MEKEAVQELNLLSIWSPSKRSHQYTELEQFRRDLERDKRAPHQKPYSAFKSAVMIYKTIFLGFAALFVILGAIIYSKSFTWSISLLFGESIQLRGLMLLSCVGFSTLSASFGIYFRPDREASNQLMRTAKYQLSKLYERKKIENGIRSLVPLGEEYHKFVELRHDFQHVRDEMRHVRDETGVLLSRIVNTHEIKNEQKEDLLNQALLEMRDKLMRLLEGYQRA